MSDDIQLLRRFARTGDEDAFRELVARHINLVYSAALRQVNGDAHLAEDVAQSVFADLARKARSLSRDVVLTGWLYDAARFAGAKTVRGEQRRHAREQKVSTMHDSTTESGPDWEHLRTVLDTAMGELNATDRNAVLLRFFEQKDFRAIGVALGLTEGAAQKRVARSLDKLRAKLARRGAVLPATAIATAITAGAVQSAPAGLAAAITATALASGPSLTAAGLAAHLSMSKIKILSAVVAGVLVTTPVVMQNRNNDRLRDENEGLRRQLNEAAEQRSVVAHAQTSELERLRSGQSELLRLRGEVGRLRQQLSDIGKQSAQPTQDLAAVEEPARTNLMAFGTELRDFGAATPERAASSLIWAAMAGEPARVSELLELPGSVPPEEAAGHYEFFTRQLGNVFRTKEFVSVQGIKPNADGTLRLNFACRDGESGRTNPFPFMLRLHDSGWKVVVEGEPPPGWQARR